MAMGDLTIRGAGIFGLSIAWEALDRGARVRVIDPGGPGAGASGGVVGALQPHTPDPWNPKKQFQLDSLLMAEALWSKIDAVSGINSGYSRVGRLQPLASEREIDLARSRETAAATHWGTQATWSVIDRAATPDWHPPSPTGAYLHDTLSAIVNPRHAVQSLAAAIQSRGGEIATESPDAAPIIWATGWQGLMDLGNTLQRPAGSGVKGQAALLRHDAAGLPQIYANGLHIVPHLDGTLAVGSTSERDFDDPKSTDAVLDDVIQRAAAQLPILKGASVLARWAGVRPRSPSRAPLLGPWPDRPGHWIANGGFKIGFGVAPMVARVICDLVLDGRDTIPAEFHTDRLA
ncbi:MAG: FAD-binding oxidoreductase [Silicimonas sp.]|nr:FAD-binding oxidoreductase [Silicimonas sp.]